MIYLVDYLLRGAVNSQTVGFLMLHNFFTITFTNESRKLMIMEISIKIITMVENISCLKIFYYYHKNYLFNHTMIIFLTNNITYFGNLTYKFLRMMKNNTIGKKVNKINIRIKSL